MFHFFEYASLTVSRYLSSIEQLNLFLLISTQKKSTSEKSEHVELSQDKIIRPY